MEQSRFTEKRNYEISHVELPEQWRDHKAVIVPDRHIAKAIGLALRLMKKIDRHRLGRASPYLWREVRKRRYEMTMPGKIGYMLLPFMRVDDEARSSIVREEAAEGRAVWTEMETMLNGRRAIIRVAKEWGIIDLAGARFVGDE